MSLFESVQFVASIDIVGSSVFQTKLIFSPFLPPLLPDPPTTPNRPPSGTSRRSATWTRTATRSCATRPTRPIPNHRPPVALHPRTAVATAAATVTTTCLRTICCRNSNSSKRHHFRLERARRAPRVRTRQRRRRTRSARRRRRRRPRRRRNGRRVRATRRRWAAGIRCGRSPRREAGHRRRFRRRSRFHRSGWSNTTSTRTFRKRRRLIARVRWCGCLGTRTFCWITGGRPPVSRVRLNSSRRRVASAVARASASCWMVSIAFPRTWPPSRSSSPTRATSARPRWSLAQRDPRRRPPRTTRTPQRSTRKSTRTLTCPSISTLTSRRRICARTMSTGITMVITTSARTRAVWVRGVAEATRWTRLTRLSRRSSFRRTRIRTRTWGRLTSGSCWGRRRGRRSRCGSGRALIRRRRRRCKGGRVERGRVWICEFGQNCSDRPTRFAFNRGFWVTWGMR